MLAFEAYIPVILMLYYSPIIYEIYTIAYPLLSSLFCRAQAYLLKESEVTEKDCYHMYFRQPSGRFADLRCSYDGKGDPVTLRVYDGALKQLSSHEIGEIGEKVLHTGLSDGRQLLLGFADRKNNVYAYSINPADGRAKLIRAISRR